jgi:hypothetical protein
VPIQKLILKPGINVQRTPLLQEGGWSSANLIRFREGLPEVYGGWVPFVQTPVQGVCRGVHAWTTLAGINSLGAGTNLRLYLMQGGAAYDITPIVQTTMPTDPFTTVAGSRTVTVLDPTLAIVPTVGSFVEVSGATAVGGVTLSGEYTVQNVLSSTSYTLTGGIAAASSATGGGTPSLGYLLPVASPQSQPASGWGVQAWGAGTWGTPRSASTGVVPARTWTIDNWGEQMIACPRGGGIFVWLPSGGAGTRAAPLASAPEACNAIFVSNAAEQIIALGSAPAGGGAFDPMLVSWCDYGDYNTWLADATNAAGNYHLTDGSQLMAGARAGQQNLIWSDTALYSMQFIAGQLIYGFQQLGTGCGLIAPQAAGVAGNIAAWMSGLNFMVYNGTVQVLDCPVRDAVYKNLNLAQAGKIVCGVNTQFSEMRWDYPSLNATENDSYVAWNYEENTWTLGGNGTTGVSIARTAWIDYTVFGNPIAFDANGASWLQESGYSAGGKAMPWFIQSADIDIAQGEQIAFCDWLIPDQIMSGGPIGVSVFASRYPGDAVVGDAGNPFRVTAATEFVTPRLRGRQMAIRFDNSFNAIGVFWRLGALRARLARDGRN